MSKYQIIAAVNVFERKVFVRVDDVFENYFGVNIVSNGFVFRAWTREDDERTYWRWA